MIQKRVVTTLLQSFVPMDKNQIAALLEPPPQLALGDLAFPCFALAKSMRKSPAAIAVDIAEQINSLGRSGIHAQAAGAYLNFYLDRKEYGSLLLDVILQEHFGQSQIGNGIRIIIDMSSPNIAKPFGIGHLRSTVIGGALYRMYTALGYEAVRVNHLGDWGTQFGKMIAAYKRWGNADQLQSLTIKQCLDLYVKFHDEAEAEPELEIEARHWFLKLEQGDEEAHKLWQFFVSISLEEFERMYRQLDVKFDHYLGESFYNDKMDAVVQELRTHSLLEESDGALVVRLDEHNIPPCLILKSDGTTIYPTRDLATAIYRYDTMRGDRLLYVVGNEQTLHFNQVFSVLNKMGRAWSKECEHVSFGLMKFEGKKMSTRRGKVIFLEEVLSEAIEHAKAIIEQKNPDLSDKDNVAEAVGIGAILFGDLKNNRMNEVNFSMEDALNFDGETGPYVQYTYARTQSVLSKGNMAHVELLEIPTEGLHVLESDAAWDLINELANYPAVLQKGTEKNEPSIIARYLLLVCRKFNLFYHEERILVDDESIRTIKLQITCATGKVLKLGLNLLGIQSPEQM
ncbi:arginine--tRNA ligase [Paenibacillus albiflavus]|uniref:Arginine--tRNA ligase n=1 Tax=Paenibacillus albiflavus TaxID=2545760 RepID=A0A4R4ECP9_9BACL|nr:arginine--tRNA ligase [Paenibacillus albiflavus]TCZ77726.1 arginine--tRNA ligase [Paenibacillus albiflavus]